MKRSSIVYFLFLLSGITALVYEIVWARMLTLVFGHTIFSVSIVLAAFMTGLGFGSYYFGHVIDHIGNESKYLDGDNFKENLTEGSRPDNPLLIYGYIEILIFLTCTV